MTREQCRAARALIGWSQQQLADAAAVGVATIRVFEGGGSEPRSATLQVLCLALEAAGVVFLADGELVEGGPGVRLRK
ncbi:helix-turn-helix domain-containing protein [Mesorhizobium sp.]|uniref:helix-turn-helix domain-containing protein n=2 Tax=unclassified Mesorhizobium TaxID=325217 RepID=UPI0012106C6C|nr:helix-turn-helix domain-containing protein [Mesorhizobium sp.]TIM87719.1 MAG: transcriptional regulator [Mesorhizobium sp.]